MLTKERNRLGIGTLLVATLVQLLAFAATSAAQEVPGCGNLDPPDQYGPWDYRDPAARGEPLTLVEGTHFTADVETLRRGASGPIIGDIDYTLRAFPNHHRALNSMTRYALAGGSFARAKVPSAECYFKRAVAFRPDDEVVRMIYANYLAKRDRQTEAKLQYEEALRLAPNSAEVNYNAGLFYLGQGDLQRAKQLATVAYAGGYPLPGLKKKIAEAESRR